MRLNSKQKRVHRALSELLDQAERELTAMFELEGPGARGAVLRDLLEDGDLPAARKLLPFLSTPFVLSRWPDFAAAAHEALDAEFGADEIEAAKASIERLLAEHAGEVGE